MRLLKLLACGVLFTPFTFAYPEDLITIGGKVCIGVLCKVSSEVAEGMLAKGEVKGLREQNLTLQNYNQTLQNSLESTTAQLTTSQATEAALVAIISNLTNNLAAAHIAKQQAEAAAALAVQAEKEKGYAVVKELSRDKTLVVVLGATLAIGATAVVVYAVYSGASSYIHNRSKTAAHQQLTACTEGNPASWAQSRNCEKEFQEFARYAQGEELLREQERFSTRLRTS